jgi:nicotinamide riboside transporter PnuC
MPKYAYAILVAGWLIWLTPFLRAKQSEKPAKQVDRRARWGILLVAIAYTLLLQGHFWERSLRPWQAAVSTVLFIVASLLSWTGARSRPSMAHRCWF